jgi:hypothetical protein
MSGTQLEQTKNSAQLLALTYETREDMAPRMRFELMPPEGEQLPVESNLRLQAAAVTTWLPGHFFVWSRSF